LDHHLRRQGRPNERWTGVYHFDLVDRMEVKAKPFTATFVTDEHGLRNPPGLEQPTVFVAGDSIVVGMPVPVEQTVAQRIGAYAKRVSMAVAEVGYAPQESLRRLELIGRLSHGAAVVHLVFEGNDLMDSQRWRAWRERPFRADWPQAGFFKSAIVLLKSAAASGTVGRHGWVRDVPGHGDEPIHFLYDAKHTDAYIAALPDLVRDLEEASRSYAERGILYVVAFVPQKLTVFHSRMRWPAASPLADPAAAKSRLRTELAASLRDSGLRRFVDTTEALQGCFERGELPFYPADTHLAACGHDAIARAVAPVLTEHFATH
jgi:hypothetical protein